MDLNKGSLWRKWDLHVHTPASFHWKEGKSLLSMTPEETEKSIKKFIKTVNESDIAVFCVMDYWTFDWCIELKKYIIKNPLNLYKTVLFGMELRIECPVDYRLNIHVILSDSLTIQQLNDFKSNLRLRINAKDKTLSNEALIELAKSFDKSKAAKHGYGDPNNLSDKELLELGSKAAVITRESLMSAFNSFHTDSGYIILPYDTSDGILNLDWQKHPQDDNFFMQTAHIFESRDERNIDLFNGHRTESNNKFFDNFLKTLNNKCKPCISGSDAHKFSEYGIYPSNKVTWIKADPTFEGLKQIIYEPDLRVKIQERNPSNSKPDRIIIDYLSFKDTDGVENIVQLNKDLNSIVGIRGSGKSTLIKNIAFSVDPKQFADKDREDKLYKLNKFEVIWSDSQKNRGTADSPKNIFYIPQNYLSAISYDDGDKSKERDIFLTKLLKKNQKFANALMKYEEFTSQNKVKIEQLIQDFLNASASIVSDTELLHKQGSRKEIEEEIQIKNKEIKEYNKTSIETITEEEISKYSHAMKIIIENKRNIEILKHDRTILVNLSKNGANIFISNQEFNQLSSERRNLIKDQLTTKSTENLVDLIQEEINLIDNKIEQLDKDTSDKEVIIKSLENKIKTNKAIDDLTKEIGNLQQILQKIIDLENKITSADIQRNLSLELLVSTYFDFDIQQKNIFNTVDFGSDFTFLNIDLTTTFNIEDLKIFVDRNINTRDTTSHLKKDPEINDFFSQDPSKPTQTLLKKILLNLINNNVVIKVEASDTGSVISQLLKNRYEIDFLNSVKTKDNIPFKNMTGGQKAIALLELIFKFDDERYPILIDQPEDDLDVIGIATDLVNFIKSEKNERQIIIVSHNASLVICADTEEIIVSNCVRNTEGLQNFHYITGSIENPDIREKIINILEGGKEALRKRALKLNFKNDL